MNDVKLSVIVPIYNVEEFLQECLDSLVNQTLRDIEVLMIDDGSTDNSAIIAKLYEKKFDNFHYIYKENGGLGNARNFGIPYVKGEFLIFLDSDDIIPIDAYEKMYNAAIENNVDIVCGNMMRFNSKEIYDSYLHKKIYKKSIKRTHISEYKNLIYDTTSTNKMFKTSFYTTNCFKFPEGIYYEDIPMVIPALWKAKSVSILTDTCYLWRSREGENKSITQKRTTIKNFVDRIKVMDMVDSYYEKNVFDEDCIAIKDYKWLDTDLKLFINQMHKTSSEYNEIAMREINRFLNKIDIKIYDSLRTIDKIKYFYIKENDIKSLLEVLKFQKSKKNFNIKKKGNKYYADFPFKVKDDLLDMMNEFNLYPLNHKVFDIEVKGKYLNVYLFMRLPKLDSQFDFKSKAYLITEKCDKKETIEIKRVLLKYDKYFKYTNSRKTILKSIVYRYFYLIKIDITKLSTKEFFEQGANILIDYENDIISKEFIISNCQNSYSFDNVEINKIDDALLFYNIKNIN